MPIDRRMDKEDVVHIYNGILLSIKRNKIGSFVETWMDLEIVIQSEVSQKEKNKYRILCIYVEPRKMVQINWFAGQKLRHRCREQTYGHQGGKAVWCLSGGVMNWAIGIDMYTLMCIKWMTNTNLLYKKQQTNKQTN